MDKINESLSSITSTIITTTPAQSPFPYVAGQTLCLKTTSGRHVQLTLTRLYSVTMSPVLEVRLKTPDGPKTAILKLFDRRFGESRKKHPYSQEAEAVWQKAVRSGLAKELVEDLQHEDYLIKMARFKEGDESSEEEDDCDDDDDGDDDDDEEEDELAYQEARIYHKTQRDYRSEVRAYDQLKALQGRCVARFIDSVIYDVPEAPEDLPPEYFQVPGILIERIHGFPLAELTTKLPDQPALWEKIVEEAIDMVREVNRAGVVHHDCQPRNLVVAERDGGFQSYLIDFAQCGFRDDYKDTEDLDDENGYAHIVHLNDNHGAVAVLMGMRVKREVGYKLRLERFWSTFKGQRVYQ